MYTFNGYCKTVIRFAAINAWRDRSRLITVIFAFCGFVGSRGKNIAVTLAKSPLAALKVLREASTAESVTF